MIITGEGLIGSPEDSTNSPGQIQQQPVQSRPLKMGMCLQCAFIYFNWRCEVRTFYPACRRLVMSPTHFLCTVLVLLTCLSVNTSLILSIKFYQNISAQWTRCVIPPHHSTPSAVQIHGSNPHFISVFVGDSGRINSLGLFTSTYILGKRATKTFCKGPRSKYFGFCGPDSVCQDYSTLPILVSLKPQIYINRQAWLYANKTLFTKKRLGKKFKNFDYWAQFAKLPF